MDSCRGRALCRRWTWAAGAVVFGLVSLAQAEPVAFRGTVVTDIRLGAQNYHNAALKLAFVGDTADIAEVTDSSGNPIPSSCQNTVPPNTNPYFFWITKGSASFSFESAGKRVSGKFLPGQLFVSVDTCSGGFGFGSFTPQGFEPIYPLAFTHGSAQALSFASANPLSTAGNWTSVRPRRRAASLRARGRSSCRISSA